MSMTDDILVTPSLHLAEQLSTHRRCHRLLVVSKETKASSAVRAFENELGVQAPLGFWDPAGLSSDARLDGRERGRIMSHVVIGVVCSCFVLFLVLVLFLVVVVVVVVSFFLATGSMVKGGRAGEASGCFHFWWWPFWVCERWGTRSLRGTLLQSTAFPRRSHQAMAGCGTNVSIPKQPVGTENRRFGWLDNPDLPDLS